MTTRNTEAYDRMIPNREATHMASSRFNLARHSSNASLNSLGAGAGSGRNPSAAGYDSDFDDTTAHALDSLSLQGGSFESTIDTTSSSIASSLADGDQSGGATNPAREAYKEQLAKAVGISTNHRILAFKAGPPTSNASKLLASEAAYTPASATRSARTPGSAAAASLAKLKRRILNTPDQILDAPDLKEDYYLNLLDWSSENMVAIGLGTSVYLWNANTGDVSSLFSVNPDENPNIPDYISSVSWSKDGCHLAVGISDGVVEIWDAESGSRLRKMAGHSARVGAMSWNDHILSSGSRDTTIWHHDVRIAQHKTAVLSVHTNEVCGLQWRSSDGMMLASGGNDNMVHVWDARSTTAPRFSKSNHSAAVRAIAWCPWQTNLLATGGGGTDRQIHFWNTTTAARLHSVDAGSQVTSIQWSKEYKEFCSTHGFPDNNISVWAYPSLAKIIDIPAHDNRVLHSAISPDGQTVATASSDESLKFWKLFESKPVTAKGKDAGKEANGLRSAAAAAAAAASAMRIR
ncbi:WD40 repeat-like protein [Ramicandelaber brevisporus]|nr:WD40 repeat-like protein [Ramicandelaber brevisporus]